MRPAFGGRGSSGSPFLSLPEGVRKRRDQEGAEGGEEQKDARQGLVGEEVRAVFPRKVGRREGERGNKLHGKAEDVRDETVRVFEPQHGENEVCDHHHAQKAHQDALYGLHSVSSDEVEIGQKRGPGEDKGAHRKGVEEEQEHVHRPAGASVGDGDRGKHAKGEEHRGKGGQIELPPRINFLPKRPEQYPRNAEDAIDEEGQKAVEGAEKARRSLFDTGQHDEREGKKHFRRKRVHRKIEKDGQEGDKFCALCLG